MIYDKPRKRKETHLRILCQQRTELENRFFSSFLLFFLFLIVLRIDLELSETSIDISKGELIPTFFLFDGTCYLDLVLDVMFRIWYSVSVRFAAATRSLPIVALYLPHSSERERKNTKEGRPYSLLAFMAFVLDSIARKEGKKKPANIFQPQRKILLNSTPLILSKKISFFEAFYSNNLFPSSFSMLIWNGLVVHHLLDCERRKIVIGESQTRVSRVESRATLFTSFSGFTSAFRIDREKER